MGNTVSQTNDPNKKSLEYVVNYITSQYIRSQNFKDMKDLSNLEYCDKLIILTSKIINKYLDESDVKYLSQKKGVLGEQMKREKILAIDRDNLDSYDVKDTVKKRRLCIGLARHYVQVANIFAAIATTVNPKYNYKDDSGNMQMVSLEEVENVPENVTKKISRNNLCSNRVSSLLNNQDLASLEQQYDKGTVTLNPDFCKFNCSTCPVVKSLDEEPGIPELEKLYLDKYDYDTGKFIGMTANMEKLYRNDVIQFYKTFTGNDSIPETVTRFSDIKLKDYNQSSLCADGTFNAPVTGAASSYNFYNYIENIRSMMDSTKKFHDILLDILDKIFVFALDPKTNDKTVILNPDLTDSYLAELTELTIKTITGLYISCEAHFSKGVDLYAKIATKQLMKTAKSQLFNLKSMQEQIAAAPNEKPSSEPIKPNPDLLDELDTSLIEDSQPKEEITSTTETIEDSEPKEDLASATEAMEEAKEAMEDAKESMEEAKTELEETKETMADIEKSVPTSDNNKSPAIALDIKPEAIVESKDTSNKNNIEKLDAETEKLLEEAKKIEAMTLVVNKENTELNKQKEEQKKIFTPTPETVSPSPQSENLGNISSVTK
tara:strand:+ start:308 stop:2119 length:1812 start_codon:yes stop_codon:yes gene_type:complete